MNERQAILYNFDRKNISVWKKTLSLSVLTKLEVPKIIKVRSESVSVLGVIALNQELKLLKQQLTYEKLRSEALMTLIEVAELELQISIQKKPLPSSQKNKIVSYRYFN